MGPAGKARRVRISGITLVQISFSRAGRPPAVAQRFSVANGAAEPRLDRQGNPSDCPFAALKGLRHRDSVDLPPSRDHSCLIWTAVLRSAILTQPNDRVIFIDKPARATSYRG